jgi:peptidoglycan/LPS O-acetylase OafA/YrhL
VAPLGLSFVIAQYVFHIVYGLTYIDVGIPSLLLALLSIAFVVTLCMSLSAVPISLLVLLGSTSMAIYLVHILVVAGIRIVSSRFLHIHDLYLLAVLGCIGGVFISVAVYKLALRLGMQFLFAPPKRLSLELNLR